MSALDSNGNQPVTTNEAGAVPRAETAPEGRATEPPDRFHRRRVRIEEHLRESLEHEDTRTSIIGAVMADIMQLELQVGEALQEALGPGRIDPQDLTRNREGIEMFLKLAKQVAQYTQLHRKLRKDAEPAPVSENQSE